MKVRPGAPQPTHEPASPRTDAARPAAALRAPTLDDVLELGRANIQETLPMQTRARGLPTYVKALPGVTAVLERLAVKPGSHWLDGGAGYAGAAVLGFLEFGTNAFLKPEYRNGQTILPERRPPKDLTVTLLDLDCRATPTDRVRVLSGRFIEQIPEDELPRCDLITEVEGPFSYSARPDLVLARYVSALKDDGVLFLGLGSTMNLTMPGRDGRVVCADGQIRPYVEWLQTLKGLDVVPHRYLHEDLDDRFETMCAEIRRRPGEAVEIPELATLKFEGGGPPRMLLIETASALAKRPALQAELEGAARRAFEARAARLGTGEVLDLFRSGPLDTALARATSEEGGWRHVGALAEGVKQDLAAGKIDASARYPVGPQLAGVLAPGRVDFRAVDGPEALAGAKGLAVITDHGVLAASARPDLVLRTYLDALADGGELFISFGARAGGVGRDSRVLTRKDKDLSLAEWLATIPGLEVEVTTKRGERPADDATHVRVQLRDRGAVQLRTLEPLGATPREDGPSPFLFREDLTEPAPERTFGDVMNGVALRVWKAMW